MQPTIVVVNAELYCVHSTVEYIRTNLQNNMLSHYGWRNIYLSMKCDFAILIPHRQRVIVGFTPNQTQACSILTHLTP